jgi:putative aldouronate transport system substrate-binding protein
MALINSFIYYRSHYVLDASGNNVVFAPAQPAFRQALQYLNSLYTERVLDASTFTVDQQGFRGVLNADPMVVGFTSMGSIGNFVAMPHQDQNPNFLAMTPLMAPLSSPQSPGYSPYNDYTTGQQTFITNRARNVDLAVKVMDSFYEPTLSIMTRFGEENVDWTRDPAILATETNSMVALGLYPGLSIVCIRDVWATAHAQHWMNPTPRYTPLDIGNTIGFLYSPYDPSSPSAALNALNYQLLIPRHPQYILPTLRYSASDAVALSQIITIINEYVNQSIAEFTIGTRDINSDTAWNAYLRELDNMGLQQWLRIAQATYNQQR